MKKIHVLLYSLPVIALFALRGPRGTGPTDSAPESYHAKKIEHQTSEAVAKPLRVPEPVRHGADEKVPEAIGSEKDFLALIDEANLTQTITIAQATQRLRTLEPQILAQYFNKALVDLGQTENDRRERLVYLANEVQSDALLPFWKVLLTRKIPRYEDEAKYLTFGEPTEEMQSIHLELLNSVRNLGLIAPRDHQASVLLADVILHPTSPLQDEFIRERAYISLKEADLPTALRVLKTLDGDDALRGRLSTP
ncbi:MAG: hypothetical protein H7249_06555 [Chitinophagaceae bacterium]|nr:hypothetical protein [Oligoflexus sp.]